MARVKRHYQSDIRAAAALETRRSIVSAAAALFAARGYAATPIEAIAREAGVAVQTVYAVFGTKRAVLESLLASMEEEARLDDLLAALEGAPRSHPPAIAAFFSRLFGRGAAIMTAARSAGAADRAMHGLMKKGLARHRRAMRMIAGRWAKAGALRPGLNEAEAVDSLSALTSFALFAELRESGWSRARYERWLAGSITRLLLAR